MAEHFAAHLEIVNGSGIPSALESLDESEKDGETKEKSSESETESASETVQRSKARNLPTWLTSKTV